MDTQPTITESKGSTRVKFNSFGDRDEFLSKFKDHHYVDHQDRDFYLRNGTRFCLIDGYDGIFVEIDHPKPTDQWYYATFRDAKTTAHKWTIKVLLDSTDVAAITAPTKPMRWVDEDDQDSDDIFVVVCYELEWQLGIYPEYELIAITLNEVPDEDPVDEF